MTEDISSGKKATAPFLEDGSLDVSLIIPAYNAADTLRRAVEVSIEQLSTITQSYEVLIAEDGSEDGTAQLAEELSQLHECVVHLHSEKRCGKGKALSRAIEMSCGEVIAFMDADLASEPSLLGQLIEAVRKDGYDCSIGSRKLPKSYVERSLDRRIATAVYNILVRLLLASGVHDHQCGFKAFRRGCIVPLLDEVRDERWFWDTEVLVRMQRKGGRIYELPISWSQGNKTNISFKGDVMYMGLSLLKLFWELRLKRVFGLGKREKF
ncbi:MAG: glycosyltransferase [Methermicoccaceae archaeon]